MKLDFLKFDLDFDFDFDFDDNRDQNINCRFFQDCLRLEFHSWGSVKIDRLSTNFHPICQIRNVRLLVSALDLTSALPN